MDRLVLGKRWASAFELMIPHTSSRKRIRMAWHLAALGVNSDDELAALTEVELCRVKGGHKDFLKLRSEYQARLTEPQRSGREAARTETAVYSNVRRLIGIDRRRVPRVA